MKTNANGNDDKGVLKIKEQKLSYFESIHSYAYNLVDKVYETLFAFAQTPGKFEVAGLLEQTLTEKKKRMLL